MNMIFEAIVAKMKLQLEWHLHPYRATWVDKTSLLVYERCQVPITMGDYSNRNWDGVLLMDVSYILLGLGYMTLMLPIMVRKTLIG